VSGRKHADAHCLAGARREELRPGERAGAQLTQVEVPVRELQELRAELVLVAVRVLLNEPVVVQRPQQAVHGGFCEAEPLRELAHAESTGAG
jgi:hypothetical protein